MKHTSPQALRKADLLRESEGCIILSPDHCGPDGSSFCYFVLGCFERRVTVYSQQIRALNLEAPVL
jgi:hypothetical protein